MNPGIGRFGGVALAGAALLGIAGLLAAAVGEGVGQVSAQGTSVAVVDPIEVMDALNEAKEMMAQFTARGDELKKKIDDAKVKEAALKSDWDTAVKDDPTKRDKEMAYKRAALAREAEQGLGQQLLDLEAAEIRRKLYTKVLLALEAIAVQNRIDLVLNDDRRLPPVGGSDSQVVIAIRQGRKVLYRSEPIDITQQVIARMNNDFLNKRD